MQLRSLLGVLAGALVAGCSSRAVAPERRAMPVPDRAAPAADGPAVVALGRALFHDKVLSGNRNIACNTCHAAAAALGDALPVSLGEGAEGVGVARRSLAGRAIARNAPALWSSRTATHYLREGGLFWDSRVASAPLRTPDHDLDRSPSPELRRIREQLENNLAAQALFPVTEPDEMRGRPGTNELADAPSNVAVWRAVMVRLVGARDGTEGGIAGYRTLFHAAYPFVAFDDLNFGHAARAIAAFIRETYAADETAYDRHALTPAQERGYALFTGRANCEACHMEPLFSDLEHHALAVPQIGPGKGEAGDDRGLALVTGSSADNYKFRTPPLRNVALTGPWMHDGCFTTLEDVIKHHADPVRSLRHYKPEKVGLAASLDTDRERNEARIAALDPLLATPIALSEGDVRDLVAFLEGLTDPGSLERAARARPASVPSGLPVD
jgi:cytochrome c peroxidase